MKAVTISDLKAHLSRYLRMVRRGERIAVLDRTEAIAELGPPPAAGGSPWQRLAREGRLALGSQDWATFKPTPLPRAVPIQQLLAETREDTL